MNQTQQRKLVVSEWITLDGVFDADSMETWFNPYETEDRGRYIKEGIDAADALLFGRVTYEMLAQYWPNLKNNEMGVADRLNSLPKYVVSRTLKRADWNNSTSSPTRSPARWARSSGSRDTTSGVRQRRAGAGTAGGQAGGRDALSHPPGHRWRGEADISRARAHDPARTGGHEAAQLGRDRALLQTDEVNQHEHDVRAPGIVTP